MAEVVVPVPERDHAVALANLMGVDTASLAIQTEIDAMLLRLDLPSLLDVVAVAKPAQTRDWWMHIFVTMAGALPLAGYGVAQAWIGQHKQDWIGVTVVLATVLNVLIAAVAHVTLEKLLKDFEPTRTVRHLTTDSSAVRAGMYWPQLHTLYAMLVFELVCRAADWNAPLWVKPLIGWAASFVAAWRVWQFLRGKPVSNNDLKNAGVKYEQRFWQHLNDDKLQQEIVVLKKDHWSAFQDFTVAVGKALFFTTHRCCAAAITDPDGLATVLCLLPSAVCSLLDRFVPLTNDSVIVLTYLGDISAVGLPDCSLGGMTNKTTAASLLESASWKKWTHKNGDEMKLARCWKVLGFFWVPVTIAAVVAWVMA